MKSVVKLIRHSLLLGLCGLMPQMVWALSEAAWLYAVERPVAAQSDEERERAAREGLLIVLSRLTGLVSVPRSEEIVKALAAPDDFYTQFVFFVRHDGAHGGAEEQRFLRITFQADAIQALIKSAVLPVWWSKRPKILAWIALDDGGNREILSSASQHPLVVALRDHARLRGIPMTMPLMDLDDRLAVSATDVWGKLRQSLDTAGVRYGAELTLIGRVSHTQATFMDTQPYRGDWEIWLNGEPLVENFHTVGAEQAAMIGIDMLANRLTEQFAVLPRQQQLQRIAVSGLDDTGSYADFMRYLDSMEFVDRVDVTAIDTGTLHIALTSRAQMNQLLMLLTTEGRLIQDQLHRGFDIRLIWQG